MKLTVASFQKSWVGWLALVLAGWAISKLFDRYVAPKFGGRQRAIDDELDQFITGPSNPALVEASRN